MPSVSSSGTSDCTCGIAFATSVYSRIVARTTPITFTVSRGAASNVAASVHYVITLPGGGSGADVADLAPGPVLSGDLSPWKARIVLMLALQQGAPSPEVLASLFET